VAKLPIISGEELIKALRKDGFQVARRRGSHISLQKGGHRTVVPLHDELSRGTLLGILKQCGLNRDELIKLLEKI
jgi:predicted RNA binding protein YcfA (HicA-like mRNA interferase family)